MKPINLSQFDKRYNVMQKIGSGSFGEVYRIQDTLTKKYLALKKIKLKKNQSLTQFLREIQIQIFLAHPLVLKIFEFYLFEAQNHFLGKRQQIGIVMELGQRSLLHLIKDKNEHFHVEEIINFAYHFIKLFAYFQDQNIVHRDIKPENFIQFGQGLQCKLIDFGLCTHVNDIHCIAGSFHYFSPKLKKLHYNPKMKIISNPYKDDVYSFGLTLYELITRKVGQAAPRWGNSQYSRDIFHCTKDSELTNIIQLMLEDDEDKRPDFIELFEIFNEKFTFYEEQYSQDQIQQLQMEKISSKKQLQKNLDDQINTMQKKDSLQNHIEENRKTYKPQLVYENEQYEFRTVKEFQNENQISNEYIEFHETQEQWNHQNQQENCQNQQHFYKNQKRYQGNEWQQSMQKRNDAYDNCVNIDCKNENEKLQVENLSQFIPILKPQVSQYQVSVDQNCQHHEQQPAIQSQSDSEKLSYVRKNFHLGLKISITSIIIIKEFIICGCQDGSLYIMNNQNREKTSIYKIEGMINTHNSPIIAMGRDQWGRLWTASIDGLVLIWDRPKFFKHLLNNEYYHEVLEEKIGKNGEKYTKARNYIQMHPDASFPIKLPFKHPTGISSLYCVDDLNFVIGYNDGFVFAVWDNVECHYEAHTQPVTAIKVYEDSLFTSSLDGTIIVLQLQNMCIKQDYFQSQLPIRNFHVTGQTDNPSFMITTADGRGYAVTGWTINLAEGENNIGQMDIMSVVFVNDFIFSISEKGNLYRNGNVLQKCKGQGWTCLHWNEENMMVMGSTQGELVVINSG